MIKDLHDTLHQFHDRRSAEECTNFGNEVERHIDEHRETSCFLGGSDLLELLLFLLDLCLLVRRSGCRLKEISVETETVRIASIPAQIAQHFVMQMSEVGSSYVDSPSPLKERPCAVRVAKIFFSSSSMSTSLSTSSYLLTEVLARFARPVIDFWNLSNSVGNKGGTRILRLSSRSHKN